RIAEVAQVGLRALHPLPVQALLARVGAQLKQALARGQATTVRRHAALAGAGDAVGVGRVAAGVQLGAVEVAVLVAIDADTDARSRRHAGVGQLLTGGAGDGAQLRVGDRRLGGAVALERAGGGTQPAARLIRFHSLHRQVALAERGARDHQIDARADDATVRV